MRFRTKGFTSLLLALSFSVVALSGLALYVSPKGRVANWTGWTLLGLDKHLWGAVHINICLLFLIGAVVHLYFNWRVFLAYLKNRTAGLSLKMEMGVAALVVGMVLAGTWLQVPPFSTTIAVNDKIKAYWEEGAPQGPVPHAEESSVQRFANQLRLDAEEIVEALRIEGYVVDDLAVTVGELARQKGTAPSDVFAATRKHFPNLGLRPGGGQGTDLGRGRGQAGSSGGPPPDGANDGRYSEGAGRGPMPGQGRGRGRWARDHEAEPKPPT